MTNEKIHQLEFFPQTPEEKLMTQMKDLEIHFEKMRKALFAKNSVLQKEVGETKHELDTLKQALCCNKQNLF